ncbi:hypothetical protein ACTFIY_000765 [Dictyostelium cf. discoideum]
MKKSSNKFVSPVKSTTTNNNTNNTTSNKFVSPTKTTTATTTSSKGTKPEIPTPTKTFKKSSTSFQTPTKTTTDSDTTTTTTTTTTPIKTPTRKLGSSFQTPTKLTFQTPNDSSSSSSSSSSSASSASILTKSSPVEIFKTIPQYILQYLDKYIENDKEKQDLKSIIQYSCENWNNNPFNHNDLKLSLNEDNNNSKDYIKKLILKLVENNILKEIILNNNSDKVVKVYSSIPWHKVTSYHYLEMEIKRFEKEQQQTSTINNNNNNNINNKYNKIAPKNSTVSMVATLSPPKSKSSGNHLSNSPISSSSSSSSSSTPNKKRKSPIAFNLNEIDNSNFDSSKKVINDDKDSSVSNGKNTILSSKYELQIERELQIFVNERKRILKSIAEKKELLTKFQSKSNSPVSEQKKTIPTSTEEKRIDDLILKWKKGCQDATTLLQEKLVETLAQSSSCNSGSVSGGGISGYTGYGDSKYHGGGGNNEDDDGDENKDYSEFSEYEIQEYKEQMKLAREPMSATKLYILKQFGVDPKFVNLDEENDCFLKEGELLLNKSSTNSKTIKKK